MAISPIADNVKIKLDAADPHGFSGGESQSKESGILVDLPNGLKWLGFHSFAFEDSLANEMVLDDIMSFYRGLIGKRVYWESFQDSGRRIKDGDDEFVILKITDIIAFSEPNTKAKTITDIRRTGSFKA